MGTSFVSTLGSKLGISEGSIGGTLVGRLGVETDVEALGQSYLMWDGKIRCKIEEEDLVPQL